MALGFSLGIFSCLPYLNRRGWGCGEGHLGRAYKKTDSRVTHTHRQSTQSDPALSQFIPGSVSSDLIILVLIPLLRTVYLFIFLITFSIFSRLFVLISNKNND